MHLVTIPMYIELGSLPAWIQSKCSYMMLFLRLSVWLEQMQKFPLPYNPLKASKITKTIQVSPSIETFPICE